MPYQTPHACHWRVSHQMSRTGLTYRTYYRFRFYFRRKMIYFSLSVNTFRISGLFSSISREYECYAFHLMSYLLIIILTYKLYFHRSLITFCHFQSTLEADDLIIRINSAMPGLISSNTTSISLITS
jgi:hypothetical protein